jgi:hypothetical protein
MTIRPAAVFGAALIALAATGNATAAVWSWGCQGPLDKQQVIFNRWSLIVAPLTPARAPLRSLIGQETLAGPNDRNVFETRDANGGFEKIMEFSNAAEQKLVLTETSSRTISDRTRRVGPRDEIITTMKKRYRLTRGQDQPRTIVMTCIDYTLTTKGARN